MGRECALEEYPQKQKDWFCDFDGKGDVICQVSYKCIQGGESRYQSILGIENLLRREKWGEKLNEVLFKSSHGDYSVETIYGQEDEKGLSLDSRDEKRRQASVLIQKQGDRLESEWKQIGKKKEEKMRLLEFELSYGFIVDSFDSGISSGVSWTPRYGTGGFLDVGLDVGVKQMYDEVIDSFFLSMDVSLAPYIFLSENFYFKMSLGGQQWWERQKGMYSLLGAGMGLKGLTHRVFVQYMRVGNDERNQEIHAGVGFSF